MFVKHALGESSVVRGHRVRLMVWVYPPVLRVCAPASFSRDNSRLTSLKISYRMHAASCSQRVDISSRNLAEGQYQRPAVCALHRLLCMQWYLVSLVQPRYVRDHSFLSPLAGSNSSTSRSLAACKIRYAWLRGIKNNADIHTKTKPHVGRV